MTVGMAVVSEILSEPPMKKQKTENQKCWNPGCANVSSDIFSGKNSVCSDCLNDYYLKSSFCPGCGWGYGATEEPLEDENYYVGCDECPKWTHRLCDKEALGDRVGIELLLESYACIDCRKQGKMCRWNNIKHLVDQHDAEKFAVGSKSEAAESTDGSAPELKLISGNITNIFFNHTEFCAVAETVKPTSALHLCLLAGVDFKAKTVAVLTATVRSNNAIVWQQWNVKPVQISRLCDYVSNDDISDSSNDASRNRPESVIQEIILKFQEENSSRCAKHINEWAVVSAELAKPRIDWSKSVKKRLSDIHARLMYQPRDIVEPINDGLISAGLIDPGEDAAIEETTAPSENSLHNFKPLDLVWAKVPGMLWAPGIISGSGITQKKIPGSDEIEFVIWFLEGISEGLFHKIPCSNILGDKECVDQTDVTRMDETNSHETVPSWLREEQETVLLDGEKPTGSAKYAFLPVSSIREWKCSSTDQFIKLIKGAKKRELLRAIDIGYSIDSKSLDIPSFIIKDSLSRQRAQAHTEQNLKAMQAVRPALKLQHLKLFLETNLIEMHWRTIARARQYVRAVQDPLFGGWHLIAAQDWPTDKEISEGAEDVYLVYPGTILTSEEAMNLETESGKIHSDLMDVNHEDMNRYVAEIPGTVNMSDKTGEVNLNPTGQNFFVDGIRYADPTSPIWAPAPTVNHERVQYCKLEPHHSTADNLKGFWLQRKKGETITKGEPLFWSYDCGSGKFDADFGLEGRPPPIGWKPSDKKGKK